MGVCDGCCMVWVVCVIDGFAGGVIPGLLVRWGVVGGLGAIDGDGVVGCVIVVEIGGCVIAGCVVACPHACVEVCSGDGVVAVV